MWHLDSNALIGFLKGQKPLDEKVQEHLDDIAVSSVVVAELLFGAHFGGAGEVGRVVIMKAISIRQPWAWAILHAGKDIENRSWSTTFRGDLAIHTAKIPSTDPLPPGRLCAGERPFGCFRHGRTQHDCGCCAITLS